MLFNHTLITLWYVRATCKTVRTALSQAMLLLWTHWRQGYRWDVVSHLSLLMSESLIGLQVSRSRQLPSLTVIVERHYILLYGIYDYSRTCLVGVHKLFSMINQLHCNGIWSLMFIMTKTVHQCRLMIALLTTTISQAIDNILFHCNYNNDDDNGGITMIRT